VPAALVVRELSGRLERFDDLAPDAKHSLVEGAGKLVSL
jgi:hypothetical protein